MEILISIVKLNNSPFYLKFIKMSFNPNIVFRYDASLSIDDKLL